MALGTWSPCLLLLKQVFFLPFLPFSHSVPPGGHCCPASLPTAPVATARSDAHLFPAPSSEVRVHVGTRMAMWV